MRGYQQDLDGGRELRPAARAGSQRAQEVSALLGHRPEALSARGLARLQQSAGNAAVVQRLAGDGAYGLREARSPVRDVVGRGGGRPLDPDTRAEMEARLGHDFSDVRIHDDAAAHASAVSVNAHAYTVGSDVVFQRDRYDPGSQAGRVTLAHELTHVVQQRTGPVDGTPAGGGIQVSDPADRFEREAAATAERALAGPLPTPNVQRDAPPDEIPPDEVQEEAPVQRAGVDPPAVQPADEEPDQEQG